MMIGGLTEAWEKARNKWTTMVKGKNLTGIQLWAGKDDARFSKEYMIRSIPRFILIDPKGNIVDSNAKSPANPNIKRNAKYITWNLKQKKVEKTLDFFLFSYAIR